MTGFQMAQPNDDAALIAPTEYLQIVGNNYYIDTDTFNCQHQVIVEILRRHPLNHALTATATVPTIYLQQLWHTMNLTQVDEQNQLTGRVDNTNITITYDSFRQLLHLPSAADFPGRQDFDEVVNDERLCADIRSLGYSQQLVQVSQFHRNWLTPVWYTLFSILHRCLSSKTKGIDRTNANFLRLFHGVAFHRHTDYALLLWTDLIQVVQDKVTTRRRNFVPYMRFLQLMIHQAMGVHPEIARRSAHPTTPLFRMFSLANRAEIPDVVSLTLPAGLLAYADQNAESVREYRRVHPIAAPMVPPGPAVPAQGAIPPPNREGPRMRGAGVRQAGAAGRGMRRGTTVRRGAARGAMDSSAASTTHRTLDENETTTAQTSSSESTESDTIHDDLARLTQDEHTESLSDQPVPSGMIRGRRRVSGDRFENIIYPDQGELRRKRIAERSSEAHRQAPVDPPQTSVFQVPPSTTPSHVLERGIEEAAVDLAAQLHDLPSHSHFSEMWVSDSHGEQPHNLSGLHLEGQDIENREEQPHFSPSFNAQLSLEQIGTSIPIPRTQEPTAVGQSDPAGTLVVSPPLGGIQGSGGSPTIVNITPAMNVGSTAVTSTVVASTGTPSGPGVITFPEFVSKTYLDSVLKDVQSQLSAEIGALKRLIAGKGVATQQETFAPTPPPPPPPTADPSVQELKDLLFAKLLSQSTLDTPADADLLMLLRFQTETPTSSTPSTAADPNLVTTLQAMQKSIDALAERVASLEETCKSQSQGTKRKHDDQDDPDHHAGEKQARRTEPEASTQSILQEPATEAETTTQTQTPQAQESLVPTDDDQVHDMEMSDEEFGIPDDVNLTVEKPEGGDKGIAEQAIGISEQTLAEIRAALNELFNGSENEDANLPTHTGAPESSIRADEVQEPLIAAPIQQVQWVRARNMTPFLEELKKKMFVHSIREYDPVSKYGIKFMKSKNRQNEYIKMRTDQPRQIKDVRTKLRISKIKDVYSIKLYKVWYPVFTVIREDGKEWYFTEADFPNLELPDLEFIRNDLRTRTIRTKPYVAALEAVARFMKQAIVLASIEDFQMGLECNQLKVNLLKPDQSLSNIEVIPADSILKDPEFGFVYRNGQNEKRFLRFSQLAQYSDGTLMLIRNQLVSKIKLHNQGSKVLEPEDRERAERGLKMIDEKLEFRDDVRRFEVMFAIRRRENS